MSRTKEYIARVELAIERAVGGHTKLTSKQLLLEGMSSSRNRILLNEIVKAGDRYLEIGVWRGSTFVAACYRNDPLYAVSIDNFSQFSGDRQIFVDNIMSSNIEDWTHINNDCFALIPEEKSFITNMNVYFYDGDHREEDQYQALTYYYECLADEFIFICDDWNHEPAKVGTRLAIAELNLTIHREWELLSRTNGDRDMWWNGLYIAVCEKAK